VTPGEAIRRFDRLAAARETARTVDRLAALCGPDAVRSLRADVTDAAQVRAAARRIGDAHGRVDLLVNAAGLHHGGHCAAKSLEAFRRIRDVKPLGYHALREAFRDVPVRHWCNFGSLSGVLGLPGEIDCAAASALVPGARPDVVRDVRFQRFGRYGRSAPSGTGSGPNSSAPVRAG